MLYLFFAEASITAKVACQRKALHQMSSITADVDGKPINQPLAPPTAVVT